MFAMLAIDEEDRIPISKIRLHPWINIGYDAPPASELPTPTPRDRVDESVLKTLYEFGFKDAHSQEAKDMIRRGERNQLVVTYKILIEKKKKSKKKNRGKKKKSLIEDYPEQVISYT